MSDFKLAIALLIIIFVFSYIYLRVLDNTTDTFVAEIEKLEKSVKQNKWEEAEKQLNEIQKKWSKTERWMTTLIDHQEIDNIKLTLARLSQYIHGRENTDFMAESASLKLLIHHIYSKERISWQNIF